MEDIRESVVENDLIRFYRGSVKTPFVFRLKWLRTWLSNELGISNPFVHKVDNSVLNTAIKDSFNSVEVGKSMFKFDDDFNLVQNEGVDEDNFFYLDSNLNIVVK